MMMLANDINSGKDIVWLGSFYYVVAANSAFITNWLQNPCLEHIFSDGSDISDTLHY